MKRILTVAAALLLVAMIMFSGCAKKAIHGGLSGEIVSYNEDTIEIGGETPAHEAPAKKQQKEEGSVPEKKPEEAFSSVPEVSAEPAPATPYTRDLKNSDEGEDVKALQQRLIELRYLRADATGFYGRRTEKAVADFRKENGLKEGTGADMELFAAVFSDEAKPSQKKLEGLIIGIDPGHQARANAEQEPVSPGSSQTKKKVSSGTEGDYTRVPEYKVVLEVGLLLRDLLEEEGATVVMTRETNEVNISNAERAQLFNDKKTDYALRLHLNGVEDHSVHGAFMLIPEKNPYKDDCRRAAELMIEEFCSATGAKNLGITVRSDQTGFNWCERMIINIEMGHMSNEEEDINVTSPSYQKKMAEGLLNGILAYFNE